MQGIPTNYMNEKLVAEKQGFYLQFQPEMYNRLQENKEKNGISITDQIRHAVIDYLHKYENF